MEAVNSCEEIPERRAFSTREATSWFIPEITENGQRESTELFARYCQDQVETLSKLMDVPESIRAVFRQTCHVVVNFSGDLNEGCLSDSLL
ncbi:hypothetical protein Acr_05g0015940 [Actinidia rufa]|uniref:Uncharacterized protein n=1 Tax=Actinidia rufa TaxID=165716 RepID=A0A7J0EN78_9ERIC|nr:hypothetical protein Acr_05g0015940 [Actinidia rufa]